MSRIKELFGVEIGEKFDIKSGVYETKENCYFDSLGTLNEPGANQTREMFLMGKLLTGEAKIIKHKQPILDDVEKKFIGNIIRPFDVDYICKNDGHFGTKKYIIIHLTSGEAIDLPYFSSTSGMYKRMETGKEYTPKQLGFERGD